MLAVNFPSTLDRSTAGHTCVSIPPVVGDSPRIGSLVVKSRGFVGVYRGFTISRVFSRRRFQGRFSGTADFQRSRWDNIRGDAGFPLTPASDTGEHAQTGESRQCSRITRISPLKSRPPLASADTGSHPASADACDDTDSRLNIDRRTHKGKEETAAPQSLSRIITDYRDAPAVETGFHIRNRHAGQPTTQSTAPRFSYTPRPTTRHTFWPITSR